MDKSYKLPLGLEHRFREPVHVEQPTSKIKASLGLATVAAIGAAYLALTWDNAVKPTTVNQNSAKITESNNTLNKVKYLPNGNAVYKGVTFMLEEDKIDEKCSTHKGMLVRHNPKYNGIDDKYVRADDLMALLNGGKLTHMYQTVKVPVPLPRETQ